jgi:hypothetical protein
MGALVNNNVDIIDPGDTLPDAFQKVNNNNALLESTTINQGASLIGISNISPLSATNVQSALQEIHNNITNIQGSAVSISDSSDYFTTNNVEAALANLGLFRYRTVETNADHELVYIYEGAQTTDYNVNGTLNYIEHTVGGITYRQTMAYTSGSISTITAIDGTNTWIKTFTYNGDGTLDTASDWVKQ